MHLDERFTFVFLSCHKHHPHESICKFHYTDSVFLFASFSFLCINIIRFWELSDLHNIPEALLLCFPASSLSSVQQGTALLSVCLSLWQIECWTLLSPLLSRCTSTLSLTGAEAWITKKSLCGVCWYQHHNNHTKPWNTAAEQKAQVWNRWIESEKAFYYL